MSSPRTRRAVLEAAASVLARNRSATLADVAAAAGVGRTTLHRYFPDRESLLAAAADDSVQAIEQAVADAAPDEGHAREAMRRLVAAMVSVGDRLLFVFGDPGFPQSAAVGDAPTPPDDPVLALIERGQAAGVFDPDASPVWIRHVVWALVFTGCEEADRGGLPRHGVAAAVCRTLERGIEA